MVAEDSDDEAVQPRRDKTKDSGKEKKKRKRSSSSRSNGISERKSEKKVEKRKTIEKSKSKDDRRHASKGKHRGSSTSSSRSRPPKGQRIHKKERKEVNAIREKEKEAKVLRKESSSGSGSADSSRQKKALKQKRERGAGESKDRNRGGQRSKQPGSEKGIDEKQRKKRSSSTSSRSREKRARGKKAKREDTDSHSGKKPDRSAKQDDDRISRHEAHKASEKKRGSPSAGRQAARRRPSLFDAKELPPLSSGTIAPPSSLVALSGACGVLGGMPCAMPPILSLEAQVAMSEVERFIATNPVDPEAGQRLRLLPDPIRRLVIERGPLQGTRNPSSVLIVRIREAEKNYRDMQLQIAAQRLGTPVLAPLAPSTARADPVIEMMIMKYNLDVRAANILRSLTPEQQRWAADLPLHEARNPSAFVMAQLNQRGLNR